MEGAPSTATLPPPRVCILLESYYPVLGGMETQARNLAEGLTRAGIPVLVLTRRADGAWPAREEVDGIPVHRVPPAGRSSRLRWALVLSCLPALWRLRREYDLILVPGFRALGLAAVWAGRGLGKPSILKAESCGEMSGEFFAGGLAQMRLTRAAAPVRTLIALRNAVLRRATILISLSSEMTDEYRAARVPEPRLRVIPQSVDTARFHPVSPDERAALRRKLNLPEQALLVMFSGRLVSYKGLPALVRVWENLAPRHPVARLVLVGAGGVDLFNCEAELKEFVQAHGLADTVRFTGAVRNVHEYLQAANVYAFPTENEAFPLALLEAMACGLPAVATTVGGIKDVVTDAQNGLMMAPGREEQLAAALDRLLREPALRTALGQAALETVRARYTRDLVTARYTALFEEVLGRTDGKDAA